ncbi:MAG: ribonuclease H-like domain-containing protein [Actinomycetota bacterium]|nr:ribonuclease H-like domain-containing protein [Actinomycetota bacterium]
MYCPGCGIKIDIIQNYCHSCGALISGRTRYIDRLSKAAQNQQDIWEFMQKQAKYLTQKHQGQQISDVLKGNQIRTSKGNCFLVTESKSMDLHRLAAGQAGDFLGKDLKLIYGIGSITESQLKKEGYRSMEDLASHPRFGHQARQFIDSMQKKELEKLSSLISRWYSCSHPHHLLLSSFIDLKDFLLLDIETMGLYNMPIILIGVGKIKKGSITVKQYLARGLEEEAAVLYLLKHHISSHTAFITFNGRMFDIPMIRQRLCYYGLNHDLDRIHLDLLPLCRGFWKHKLDSFRLSSLEQNILGIGRDQDLPGFMVPQFYQRYIQTGNIGTLIPVIRHNQQDIFSLGKLFSLLQQKWKSS